MSAPAALIRAYLETQSDLGTDEVILPHPWVRASPVPAATPASDRTTAPDRAHEPIAPFASLPSIPAEPTQAPAGLFETWSKALEAPKGSASPGSTPPAKARLPETSALPAFADLDAFWNHLRANPGLAAGDPAAAVTQVVRGAGPAGSPLALVGMEPGEADLSAGLAFQGEPGVLLAKMLKAIRLDAEACYRTNLVKAARAAKPSQRELLRLGQWLHLELSLVRAPITLLLGEACARAVLKVGKSIEEMRQEPFFIDGREFAVTYHPAELLQREELKRKAWEDLQWLQKRLAEGRN